MFDLTIENRLERYLGGLPTWDGVLEPLTDKSVVLIHVAEPQRSFKAKYRELCPNGFGIRYKGYVHQARYMFARQDPDAQFLIFPGDNSDRHANPTLIKSRLIADRGGMGVILPLNRKRHWDHLKNLSKMDRPFEQKERSLVWRGATTGQFFEDGGIKPLSPRYYVAQRESFPVDCDIGYSMIVQLRPGTCDLPIEQVHRRIAPKLSLKQQLRSRYILCLEGNDVATGLKWIMASNSVPVMPTPLCETWFLEGDLIPWVHFVPIARDLSDLEEVLDWCQSNDTRCLEISKAGKAYVQRFLEPEAEIGLIDEVVSTYIKATNEPLGMRQIPSHWFAPTAWQLRRWEANHVAQTRKYAAGIR